MFLARVLVYKAEVTFPHLFSEGWNLLWLARSQLKWMKRYWLFYWRIFIDNVVINFFSLVYCPIPVYFFPWLKFLCAAQVAFNKKTQPHEYTLQNFLPVPWHVTLPPPSQVSPCFKSKDLPLQCCQEPRCLKRSSNIWQAKQRFTDIAVCCSVVRLWSAKHFPDIQEKQMLTLRSFQPSSKCMDRLRKRLKN